MAKAADLSAASELSPERRKVMKEERSSLGASGTPACALNTALTSLVHCGARSGFEASAPGTKMCGCAAAAPVRPVAPSHAVSSLAVSESSPAPRRYDPHPLSFCSSIARHFHNPRGHPE